ncbi:MAG: pyruvate dehydrogenase E2 component (dihydrolipoamide acetyltransferase) [Flavobacteriales bacterium]|jgi:pyruvate dehydrogenase E2 component (dihydrolipoamide acetyltransferase)
MAEIVRMPRLSDTMSEGVVAKWHKKVGDSVEEGDLLAEIETDKATMEFESFQEGVLLHIGVNEGGAAPVDSILAILGEKGEDVETLLKEDATPAKEEVVETKKDAPVAAPAKSAEKAPQPVANQTQAVAPPVVDGRLKASPLAKKLADDKGYNLAAIPGSGDAGRIVKRDVDNFYPTAMGPTVQAVVGEEKFTEVPVSQMRKIIAKRLSESKFTAPHFYLSISVDMDNVMEARKAVNEIADVKISFNDFVVKAVAASLKKNPAVNSSWLEDKIRYNEHVNIGVAVAVEDGLLVPVVRFADGKSLSQISTEVKEFAQRAKDKKLQPADWEGSTFTISNLGMFGIEDFTAIVNPPDACILAIGGIRQIPVVKNGAVVPGNVMKVTLSCDHRVVDGASGAAFLQTFKKMLENPVCMLG